MTFARVRAAVHAVESRFIRWWVTLLIGVIGYGVIFQPPMVTPLMKAIIVVILAPMMISMALAGGLIALLLLRGSCVLLIRVIDVITNRDDVGTTLLAKVPAYLRENGLGLVAGVAFIASFVVGAAYGVIPFLIVTAIEFSFMFASTRQMRRRAQATAANEVASLLSRVKTLAMANQQELEALGTAPHKFETRAEAEEVAGLLNRRNAMRMEEIARLTAAANDTKMRHGLP